jgi:hypothetical protein
MRCPFHADEYPSFHVYPTAARGWSAGRGGSVYDLAGALWDMQARGRDFARLKQRLTVHSRAISRPRHPRRDAISVVLMEGENDQAADGGERHEVQGEASATRLTSLRYECGGEGVNHPRALLLSHRVEKLANGLNTACARGPAARGCARRAQVDSRGR